MILAGKARQHLLGGLLGVFRAVPGAQAHTMLTSSSPYDFVVIEVDPVWLSQHFATAIGSLPKECSVFWTKDGIEFSLSVRLLSGWERSFLSEILSPPLEGAARDFWLQAKILEFLSIQIFSDETMPFCTGQKATPRDRVAKTLTKLRSQMELPLNLAELAQHVGLASVTLSRLVTQETGKTLSRHLRIMRIERAKDLIRNEGYNATEASLEVGYNSLSHFTKAFFEETGQRPSDYAKTA